MNNDARPLARKLESILHLSDGEKDAISRLPLQIAEIKADQDIVREGDRPSRSCVLLEGFTCNYKLVADGKRQILAFHIPGDIPDLQSLHLKVLDNGLATITPCRVGFVQHETLREICERFPRIAIAFWRDTLIDAAVFREWMTSIGRRSAYARIAHLLCEMVVRLRVVGLTEGHTCDLPITQTEFGDALGLSLVHVNRTMQELRRAGLISFRGSTLTVLDWEGLRKAGEFDSTYLHLDASRAAA
jgi:CRP-like cAMP-binding protein